MPWSCYFSWNMPWNLPFPVKVRMLWSTLSPTHFVKCSGFVASTESLTAADCLVNIISSEEMDKPSNAMWSSSHLVANDLSASTPMRKVLILTLTCVSTLDQYIFQCWLVLAQTKLRAGEQTLWNSPFAVVNVIHFFR